MPSFSATLATLDPGGRRAAIGTGPAGIGGSVKTHGDPVVGTITRATGPLSAALLAPVLIHLDPREVGPLVILGRLLEA